MLEIVKAFNEKLAIVIFVFMSICINAQPLILEIQSSLFGGTLDENIGNVWSLNLGGNPFSLTSNMAVDEYRGYYYTVGLSQSPSMLGAPMAPLSSAPPSSQSYWVITKMSVTNQSMIWYTYISNDKASSNPAAITVHNSTGDIYITGSSGNGTFALTNILNWIGGIDVVLVHMNSAGTHLSTQVFGGLSNDVGCGIAIDDLSNIWVTGYTNSFAAAFPDTAGNTCNLFTGNNGFITSIAPNGSILFSRCFGGTSDDFSIVIAFSSPWIVVSGITKSTAFSPLVSANQSTKNTDYDTFIMKLNNRDYSVNFSSYFGGNGFDFASTIDVDDNGYFYIGGNSNSSSTWATNCEVKRVMAYYYKFDPTSNTIIYNTCVRNTYYNYGLTVLGSKINIFGMIHENNSFPNYGETNFNQLSSYDGTLLLQYNLTSSPCHFCQVSGIGGYKPKADTEVVFGYMYMFEQTLNITRNGAQYSNQTHPANSKNDLFFFGISAQTAITTSVITSSAITTQSLSTQSLTSQSLTTQELTTQELTTLPLTTQSLTTQELTTQLLTNEPVTTQPLTSQELTTASLTTQPLTTQTFTTQSLSTSPVMSEQSFLTTRVSSVVTTGGYLKGSSVFYPSRYQEIEGDCDFLLDDPGKFNGESDKIYYSLQYSCPERSYRDCKDGVLLLVPDLNEFSAIFIIQLNPDDVLKPFSIQSRVGGNFSDPSIVWNFFLISSSNVTSRDLFLFNSTVLRNVDAFQNLSTITFKQNISEFINSENQIFIGISIENSHRIRDNCTDINVLFVDTLSMNYEVTYGDADFNSSPTRAIGGSTNQNKTGVIAGVTVSIFIILIVTLIIIFVIFRKRSYDRRVAYAEDFQVSGMKHIDEVVVQERLGGGTFGDVFKGTAYGGTMIVALKKLKDDLDNEFLREAQITDQLIHVNIVYFMGLYSDPTTKSRFIVTEYCDNGSLAEYIRMRRYAISYTQLLEYALGAARGMAYLEEQNIIHGDLACRNLLLSGNQVKVADFGFSKALGNSDEYQSKGQQGFPLRSSAPEVLTHRRFSTKSDTWSMGILLHEIFKFGDIPYEGMSNSKVLKYVIHQRRTLPKPSHCPDDFWSIINDCFHQNPANRPTLVLIAQRLEPLIAKSADLNPFADILRPSTTTSVRSGLSARTDSDYVLTGSQIGYSFNSESNHTESTHSTYKSTDTNEDELEMDSLNGNISTPTSDDQHAYTALPVSDSPPRTDSESPRKESDYMLTMVF